MAPADTDQNDNPTDEATDADAASDEAAGDEVTPARRGRAPIDPAIRVDDSLFGPDEVLWARYMLYGVAAGIVAWAAIMIVVVYLLEDSWGIGGAIGVGMVPGIFGGLFFGGTVALFAYAIRHPEH